MPPSILRTKRKRGDEPPEVIYVASEESPAKRLKDDGSDNPPRFCYRRIASDAPGVTLQRSLDGLGIDASGDVLVQDIASAEAESAITTGAAAVDDTLSGTGKAVSSSRPSSKAVSKSSKERWVDRVRGHHRQFRVSKPEKVSVKSLVSAAQAGRPKRREIAVERRSQLHDPSQSATVSEPEASASRVDEASLDVSMAEFEDGATRKRKRPNVNAAERAYRDQTWGASRHAEPAPISQDARGEQALLDLAKELEAFAFQEANGSHASAERRPIAISPTLQFPSRSGLKFPPKPNPPRHHEPIPPSAAPDSAGHDLEMSDASDESNGFSSGDETLYDVYVRESVDVNTENDAERNWTALDAEDTDDDRLGVLLLNEEEAVLWRNELWGDDEEDVATDDEDENAEDYWANDYPEEESSESDDENRSYQGSDDDGEWPEWSDLLSDGGNKSDSEDDE